MTIVALATPPEPDPPQGGRSAGVLRQLNLALAGGRAVVLEGHTSDVLVTPTGSLVRLPEFLACYAAGQGAELIVVDVRTGGHALVPPGQTPVTPRVNLQPAPSPALIDQVVAVLVNRLSPTIVLLDFACIELAADPGDLLRSVLELPHDPALTGAGHQIVLAFRTTSPPREIVSQPGWMVINIGLPDAAERRYAWSSTSARRPVPLEPGLEPDDVAVTMGGLETDALLRLADEARSQGPLTRERVVEVKTAEIRRTAGEVLTVDDQPPPVAIAGMANARLYVERRLAAKLPLGSMLLSGVPGVGKTYFFNWLANRLGLPPVRFGLVKSRYVGDSERAMRRGTGVLRATAPAVVLIDEADQAGLGRRGTNLDSGVSDNIRHELFDLLNECEELGNVFVLTTNNPAAIDPAALDRVKVFPVLHPSLAESVQIMEIAARRSGWQLDTDGARRMLEARGDLQTGRQLVRLLNDAATRAALDGRPGVVTGEDLAAEAADAVDVIDRLDHEYMALCALLLADSQSAFPWVAATRLGEPSEPPPYVVQLLGRDGNLDMGKLQARVAQLKQAGHGFRS